MDGQVVRYTVTPTVGTSGHVANDVVGGLLTFAGVKPGAIQSITIGDKSAANVGYSIVFFESQPTTIADDATYNIADADLPKIVYREVLSTNERVAFSTNAIHALFGLDFEVSPRGRALYAFLITDGAPTYVSSSDITVSIQVKQGA